MRLSRKLSGCIHPLMVSEVVKPVFLSMTCMGDHSHRGRQYLDHSHSRAAESSFLHSRALACRKKPSIIPPSWRLATIWAWGPTAYWSEHLAYGCQSFACHGFMPVWFRFHDAYAEYDVLNPSKSGLKVMFGDRVYDTEGIRTSGSGTPLQAYSPRCIIFHSEIAFSSKTSHTLPWKRIIKYLWRECSEAAPLEMCRLVQQWQRTRP